MPPPKLQSVLQEALTHHRAGRLTDAAKLYARVLQIAPASFDALHLSGLIAHQQGKHREAIELLQRALRVQPQSAICEMRLGLAWMALGEFATAEKRFRGALARPPELPEAWCHLGLVLRAQGRLEEARQAYDRALALKSDYAEAHDRLGALIAETEGFAAAVPHFERAVAAQPARVEAWANLGVALAQSPSGDVTEARCCLERALALNPDYAQALTAKAFLFQQEHCIPEAIASYDTVLARHPQQHEARSGRLLALHYLDCVTREELFREHQAFGAAVGETPPRPLPNMPDPSRRLRIGFLSPDLRAHSVAYFLEPLIAHLPRTDFEIYLYHDHARSDAMSQRLQAHAQQWRSCAGLTHDALEATIRADALDVLIDLAGHTGFNRLPLFTRRLAPVQATYLGYPDTTGLAAMDLRLVDAITDPEPEANAFATERLVRFAPTAWTYQPPLDAPDVAAPPCAGGAPVTFGCFNNLAKISDATLQGWAGVLEATPQSRLLLKGHGLDHPAQQARFRARLQQLGVAPDRIDLLGRTPGIAAHLALYHRVDIALDTFPYHGTTTTCEALWMGVPVVTLRGDCHMARVGASLLHAAGHPEWIANDWSEYARIATSLASDTDRLAGLRRELRADFARGPLLDHAGQAARFGAALRGAWTEWCSRQTLVARAS